MSWLALGSLLIGLSIEFQVLSNKDPLPGQDVQLQRLVGGQLSFVASGVSGETGRIRFEIEQEENLAARYFATTSYQGQNFYSPAVVPEQFQAGPFPLQVFRPKASSEGLFIKELQKSFRVVGKQLIVEESLLVSNPTDYLLTGERTPEGREVFRIPVPRGIFNWFRLYGLDDNFRIDGNDLVITKALSPGDHFFSYGYRVVEPRIRFDASRDFRLPIERLRVSVNHSRMKINSDFELLSQGRSFYRNEWVQNYQVQTPPSFTGRLSLSVSGLSWNIPLSWWLPLFGLLLCILFAVGAQNFIRTRLTDDRRSLEPLLQELNDLDRLLEEKMIDRREYRSRRFQILQKLVPLYLSRDSLNESDVERS